MKSRKIINGKGTFYVLVAHKPYTNHNKWSYNGDMLHRTGAPAIIWKDGHTEWYNKGELHRIGGPAVTRSDDCRQWWINGIEYNEKEYSCEMVKLNIERLGV